MFAFIYRAYRKDEKYSELLSENGEDGVALRSMGELGGAGGEGGSCEAGGGGGGLLSLTSKC